MITCFPQLGLYNPTLHDNTRGSLTKCVAIFKFDVVDAIGHLLIIAILLILVIRGPTAARNMLVLRDKSTWTEAYFMTGLYSLAFVLIFIVYYGLHYFSYGV